MSVERGPGSPLLVAQFECKDASIWAPQLTRLAPVIHVFGDESGSFAKGDHQLIGLIQTRDPVASAGRHRVGIVGD